MDYEGVRKYHDPVTGIEETLVDPHKFLMVAKEQRSVYVTNLMARTVYRFNISANFVDGSWGPAASLHTETSSDCEAAFRSRTDGILSLLIFVVVVVLFLLLEATLSSNKKAELSQR